MKERIAMAIIALLILILTVVGIASSNIKYNKEEHSSDILVTEWISPDGVHYWYQQSGYHSMLAPRYDSNGELVINKEVNE